MDINSDFLRRQWRSILPACLGLGVCWFPLPVLALTHPGILRPSIYTCLTFLWRTFCDLFSLRNKKLVIELAFSETRNLAVIRCNSGSEILKIADCYNSVWLHRWTVSRLSFTKTPKRVNASPVFLVSSRATTLLHFFLYYLSNCERMTTYNASSLEIGLHLLCLYQQLHHWIIPKQDVYLAGTRKFGAWWVTEGVSLVSPPHPHPFPKTFHSLSSL